MSFLQLVLSLDKTIKEIILLWRICQFDRYRNRDSQVQKDPTCSKLTPTQQTQPIDMIGGGDPSISAKKITKQQTQLINTHQCKKVTQKIYLANLLNEVNRKFIYLLDKFTYQR